MTTAWAAAVVAAAAAPTARVLTVAPTPAFWVAVVGYALALVASLVSLSGRAKADRLATGLIALALLAHGVDIGWRGVLRVHPAESVREALGFIGFLLTGGYLVASLRQQLDLARVVVLPVSLGMLLVARLSPAGDDAADALSGLGRVHISLATLGVAIFALASAVAVLYLLKDRSLRGRRLDTVSMRGDGTSLEGLDRMGHVLVWVGFPIFTLALVLGAVWVSRLGASFWRIEYPIALVTWGCFAALLGARQLWGWRGRRAAKLTLAGFAAALVVLALYLLRRAIG
ncbi:MAG: cytochrome c biogenesis protein CcsA [Kofleriaceae bacterium]